jgi:hypothetical protein
MRTPAKALMLAAAVHVTVIAAPSIAFAQTHDSAPSPAATRSSGNDTIATKNGGMLRGTIIEALPDVQVRIQLVTGEIVAVPWPQLERIDYGAPSSSPPQAPEREEAVAESKVWVHLDASEGVLLQQDITNDDHWRTVCVAPCDKLLPTAFHYRVTGGGIKSSADFALQAPQGTHDTLVVDGASKAASVVGIVGMAVGIPVGVIALLGDLVGAAFGGYTGDGNGGFLAVTGIAALLVVGGGLLYRANKTTRVNQRLGASQTGVLQPGSWSATPTWNTSVTEPKDLPPAVGIPIFSGRF